jgi:hypothetical protein
MLDRNDAAIVWSQEFSTKNAAEAVTTWLREWFDEGVTDEDDSHVRMFVDGE